jgi:hypothetical protein
METIWDHNPTDEELEILAISRDWQKNWPSDATDTERQDAHYMMIVGLIGLRGGTPDEQYVWVNKIQNKEERLCWTMLLYEIGD